jgi:hypothetical protein
MSVADLDVDGFGSVVIYRSDTDRRWVVGIYTDPEVDDDMGNAQIRVFVNDGLVFGSPARRRRCELPCGQCDPDDQEPCTLEPGHAGACDCRGDEKPWGIGLPASGVVVQYATEADARKDLMNSGGRLLKLDDAGEWRTV